MERHLLTTAEMTVEEEPSYLAAPSILRRIVWNQTAQAVRF